MGFSLKVKKGADADDKYCSLTVRSCAGLGESSFLRVGFPLFNDR